jgi:RHS repeat-associated protein
MIQHRFYMKSHLSAILSTKEAISIFQYKDLLFAELHPGAHSDLLTTDIKRSVIQWDNATNYTVYGHDNLPLRTTLLGFNGQERDPSTHCDLLGMGKRAFSPALMRFHSPDTLSPFDHGGLNAYTYCSDDPVNFIDTSGNMRQSVIQSTDTAQSKNLKRVGSTSNELGTTSKRQKQSSTTHGLKNEPQETIIPTKEKFIRDIEDYVSSRFSDYQKRKRGGKASTLTDKEMKLGLILKKGKELGTNITLKQTLRTWYPNLSNQEISKRAEKINSFLASIEYHETESRRLRQENPQNLSWVKKNRNSQ